MAEPHITLPPSSSEKENAADNQQKMNSKEKDDIESTEENAGGSISVIEIPKHLNGSLKMAHSTEGSNTNEESSNKVEGTNIEKDQEEAHSLWRWPSSSGKFTKVLFLIL